MSILDRLSAVPGTYWGDGNGPHSGPFVARVTVTLTRAGAIALDYEAWTPGAGLQHAERALIKPDGDRVLLESTLEGQPEALAFQEGQPGVFGSLDGQQVGVVIDVREGVLSWAWWWAAGGDQLKEQSRAVVRRLLEPVALAPLPETVAPDGESEAGRESEAQSGPEAALEPETDLGEPPDDDPRPAPEPEPDPEPETVAAEADSMTGATAETAVAADAPDDSASPPSRAPISAPWPGVLVLTGMGGVAALARDLAKEVPSAAIVRGDLLARAIIGTEVGNDGNGGAGAEWRARLAARLSREYAELGHAVILAELESTGDSAEGLLMELDEVAVGPVRLLVVDETTTARDVLAELPRRGRRRTL